MLEELIIAFKAALSQLEDLALFLYQLTTNGLHGTGVGIREADVHNITTALTSPLAGLDYVLILSPSYVFLYFTFNSVGVIAVTVLKYTPIRLGYFFVHAYPAGAFIFLCFCFVEGISKHLFLNGGIMMMSGYFYPAAIMQYLGWIVAFTIYLPLLIPIQIVMLPFAIAGFGNWLSTPARIARNFCRMAMRDYRSYLSFQPMGVIPDYVEKTESSNLKFRRIGKQW